MIREANKFDIPRLIEMLWNYHDNGNIEGLHVKNEQTALKILTHILVGGGLAYVAEKNDKLIGMLLAVKTPFLWDNGSYVMSEIAYWVEPEHRGGTAGYRLLKTYVEKCDDLMDADQITKYTMSQLEGQELNYNKFGLRPIEHTWSI